MPSFDRQKSRSDNLFRTIRNVDKTNSTISFNPLVRQQLGNQGTRHFVRACPLIIPSPGVCPFGGACHLCPVQVQPKIKIGPPDDKYEREADRVADRIMHTPKTVEIDGASDFPQMLEPQYQNNPDLIEKINSLQNGNQPLPEDIREFYECRFGYDFSQVRTHTNAKAAKLAQTLNAQAFTLGRDIVFGAGQFAPGTSQGRKLIAHELTHVIQQNSDQQRRFDGSTRANNSPGATVQFRIAPGAPQIQRQIVVHPAQSVVVGFDNSLTSTQIGARISRIGVAYGLTDATIPAMNIVPDTRPRPIARGNYEIAVWSAELFPTVNNRIYVASDLVPHTCPYDKVVEHETNHVFDNYGIMQRHRQNLIRDLNTLPGPNNPTVAHGVPRARQERARINSRLDKIIDCAMNQACFDMYRANYSRDQVEYPTIFSDCPAPRPSPPPLVALHLLRVNCNTPPQGCPRPVVRFP